MESGGGALTAVGRAGSAADHHTMYPLLSSCVSESTDNDNLVTVCWLVRSDCVSLNFKKLLLLEIPFGANGFVPIKRHPDFRACLFVISLYCVLPVRSCGCYNFYVLKAVVTRFI